MAESNVVDYKAAAQRLAEEYRLRATDLTPHSEGGSGGDGGMEERVKRPEADMTEVKADLKAIRTDLTRLISDISHVKGRLDAMPTSIQLLGFAVAVFVAAGIFRFFE